MRLLLGSVFLIAACSLLYELLIGSVSTYLLGSSTVHYSLVIGLFLSSMGVGAWLAQGIGTRLLEAFVLIEVAVGIVGGASALLLQAVYAWTEYYYVAMVLVTGTIGALVGAEIPLLTRILEGPSGLRRGISQVLSVDYVGALGASLLFPFVLLPYFGHLLTAALTGLVNLVVALVVALAFRVRLGRRLWPVLGLAAAGLLGTGALAARAGAFELAVENALYQDPVVALRQSEYQRLVVTRWGEDLRLYLDGSLQFSSLDEYRYHEILAHVPTAFAHRAERALVIGGGDGLAVRELLRHETLREIVLVDLDPAVTALARQMPAIRALNGRALDDPRVSVVNADARAWLAEGGDLFDVVVVDLPDPSSEALARLYTAGFYRRVARRTSVGGAVIVQSSSPWFAARAFRAIGATLGEAFDHVAPAQAWVPSFGLWGFHVASMRELDVERAAARVLPGRYLDAPTFRDALRLPRDVPAFEDVEINRDGSLRLLGYYRDGWAASEGGRRGP